MAAVLVSAAGVAQEVTAYEYDSLGRLVRTSNSGGPNSGTSTGTCFDKAGNRAQYVVGTSGLPACATQPSSSSKPPAQPANQQAQNK